LYNQSVSSVVLYLLRDIH